MKRFFTISAFLLSLLCFAASGQAARISNFPLSTSFAGITSLQSQGTSGTGDNNLTGLGGLTIENGAVKAVITQSDTATFGGIRSEILPFSALSLNTEYWITWQEYFPSADWTTDSVETIVAQIHTLDSISAAENFFISINHNYFYMGLPRSNPPSESDGFTYAQFYLANVAFDHWYSFALHANFAADSTGFLEFFIDGIPYYRRFNYGTAYSGDAPYFKAGMYDGTHTAVFGTKSDYLKNVTLWSGASSYETVIGQNPQLKPIILRNW